MRMKVLWWRGVEDIQCGRRHGFNHSCGRTVDVFFVGCVEANEELDEGDVTGGEQSQLTSIQRHHHEDRRQRRRGVVRAIMLKTVEITLLQIEDRGADLSCAGQCDREMFTCSII